MSREQSNCVRIEEIHKLTAPGSGPQKSQNDWAYLASSLLLAILTATIRAEVAAHPDADIPGMHACGTRVHMTSLIGTATSMSNANSDWHGALMQSGQPAEETTACAAKMSDDGLLSRFPTPDVTMALHTRNELPAG